MPPDFPLLREHNKNHVRLRWCKRPVFVVGWFVSPLHSEGIAVTDLFTLLKVEGEWKIISKEFYLHS
ncbi:MAG TPA: nuclear transport factor 2 family protein [Blastocatellia bacterium]|nr:nuclear transport factor 2 family protein [Blastocatellia bacterium]